METKRLQVDLTEKEHTELDRLSALAGLKTKREFVINALTLFRWAANELAAGRQVGSFDPRGGPTKQLEMPCLVPFAEIAVALAKVRPSAAELWARVERGGVPSSDALGAMGHPSREVNDDQNSEVPVSPRRTG